MERGPSNEVLAERLEGVRVEMKTLAANFKSQMDSGFGAVNRRLDVLNGSARTANEAATLAMQTASHAIERINPLETWKGEQIARQQQKAVEDAMHAGEQHGRAQVRDGYLSAFDKFLIRVGPLAAGAWGVYQLVRSL